jgi:sulfite reductase (NADPH) hemoprotein beta-component
MPTRCPATPCVTLSLKDPRRAPGDITDTARSRGRPGRRYSFGELRATHEQNLVLADVVPADLFAVWAKARASRPGHAEHRPADRHDLLPGRRFLRLANAKSIPIADAIQARFDDLDYLTTSATWS